jgi:MoxR-like ATPase
MVEGAHAVGKTQFAADLADDLGMKHYPQLRFTKDSILAI